MVEVVGHLILYDIGSPALVLLNARALKLDLSGVEDVVLSLFWPAIALISKPLTICGMPPGYNARVPWSALWVTRLLPFKALIRLCLRAETFS